MLPLLLLVQAPVAFELTLAGGEAGFPGGPASVEIYEGPELSSAELAAVSAILGYLPSAAEYQEYYAMVSGESESVYRYMNFDQIEDFAPQPA